MTADLFDQLDREWPDFARSRAARAALSSWQLEHPRLGRFTALDPLRAELARGASPDRAELIRTTAQLAKIDPTARRLALQVMVPGLARVARSYRGRWDPDETAATVVHYALERLANWNTDRPVFFAAAIVLDANRELFVAHRRDQERHAAYGTLAPFEDALTVPEVVEATASDTLADLLADVVADRRLDPSDAELIYLTRIAGEPTHLVAAQRGLHPGTLRTHRRQAEHAFVQRSRRLRDQDANDPR